MKTNDATVLEEPKTRKRATEETIEHAMESRPRPTTGVREAKIYIDGKFCSEANAKVSVFDHGLLYGDGIFEGIRFYNGRVFRLEEHLERLWDSARSICLEIPMTRQEMTKALLETIRQNHLRDGYIRLIVTRGVGNLGLNPEQCKNPSVIIIPATIALYHEYFRRRRMFPHWNCCRNRSCSQSRWPTDRKRKTRPDHYTHHRELPRDDTRDRHTDLRLRLRKPIATTKIVRKCAVMNVCHTSRS